jgi:PAS domain S-box-containing protein
MEYHGAQRTKTMMKASAGLTNTEIIAADFPPVPSKYETFFENAIDAIFCFDLSGRITFVNPSATKLFGYTRDEFLTLSVLDLVAPEMVASAVDVLKSAQLSEFPAHSDWEIVTKQGDRKFVAVSGHVVQEHGKPLEVQGTVRDITHRRRNEVEVRKLSLAVEHSPASIVITDCNGNIEYVNPKCVEITGYTPEAMRGQNPRCFKSGEQSDSFYRDLWQTITSGREWHGEFHNRNKMEYANLNTTLPTPSTSDVGRVRPEAWHLDQAKPSHQAGAHRTRRAERCCG